MGTGIKPSSLVFSPLGFFTITPNFSMVLGGSDDISFSCSRVFSISSFGLLRNLSRYLSVSIPFLTAGFLSVNSEDVVLVIFLPI